MKRLICLLTHYLGIILISSLLTFPSYSHAGAGLPYSGHFIRASYINDDLSFCPLNVRSNSVVFKEGYTCKVATVETRPDSDKGYKEDGYVQWTLVKKEGNKEIWAAHVTEWRLDSLMPRGQRGLIYVGDVEPGNYTFPQAINLCKNKEIVINGEKIKMTLPEIGFGYYGPSDINDRPLNFELLKYLNYKPVVPNRNRGWFWSSSHNFSSYSYDFIHTVEYNAWYEGMTPPDPVHGTHSSCDDGCRGSVRCIGHLFWPPYFFELEKTKQENEHLKRALGELVMEK